MPTRFDAEKSEAYWFYNPAESMPEWCARIASQMAELATKMIALVESAAGESLNAEAAARLIDSLGGDESNHVSSEIMQDHLVPRKIAEAEGEKDAQPKP